MLALNVVGAPYLNAAGLDYQFSLGFFICSSRKMYGLLLKEW
jgi:hypothetical protein